MIDHRPHMLPKVRSKHLMQMMARYPCTVRISSFIPGHSCASPATVVGAHLSVMGKGVSTKATDMAVVAACMHCHDLIDGRDRRVEEIIERYPAAYHLRLLNALVETQSLLVRDGIIFVEGGELV